MQERLAGVLRRIGIGRKEVPKQRVLTSEESLGARDGQPAELIMLNVFEEFHPVLKTATEGDVVLSSSLFTREKMISIFFLDKLRNLSLMRENIAMERVEGSWTRMMGINWFQGRESGEVQTIVSDTDLRLGIATREIRLTYQRQNGGKEEQLRIKEEGHLDVVLALLPNDEHVIRYFSVVKPGRKKSSQEDEIRVQFSANGTRITQKEQFDRLLWE